MRCGLDPGLTCGMVRGESGEEAVKCREMCSFVRGVRAGEVSESLEKLVEMMLAIALLL